MAPWLRFLEAYLVQALLKSPLFHHGVRQVHRNVHRLRHGLPPEEMGGTKLDNPNKQSFIKHFIEELQDQAGYQKSSSQGLHRHSQSQQSGSTPQSSSKPRDDAK